MPKIARFHEVGGPEVLRIEACTMSGKMAGQAALTFRLAHQTDVDFSIDVPPFLSLSKRSNQLLKLLGMLGSVFKPRQKVEGFTNIAAMIKLPCDGR